MQRPPTSRSALAAATRAFIASVVLGTALLALLAWHFAGRSGQPRFHGTEYPDPTHAPAFLLTDQHGRLVGLESFRGRGVLLFFGFSRCPDVCPLTLQRLVQATAELRRRGDLEIVLITVDPEHDTSDELARYVAGFDARITALTGEPEALAEVRRAYGVYAARHPEGPGHGAPSRHPAHAGGERPPAIVHTDAVFGIDRAGRLRALLHADGPLGELRSDIHTLLRL